MMLGGVRVAGEAHGVRAAGEKLEQGAAVGRRVSGARRIVEAHERNVHRDGDELIFGHMAQHVLDEGELRFADASAIAAAALRSIAGRKGLDIVEKDEGRARVLKCVVRRSERALPGLEGEARIGAVEVEVVVARTMVPGNARRAENVEIARQQREVVAHHIAMVDAEGGIGAEHARDDVVAHIAELGGVAGLGVGEEQHVEALRLLAAAQREVDRRRQRSRGRDAGRAQAEIGRRSFRLNGGKRSAGCRRGLLECSSCAA